MYENRQVGFILKALALNIKVYMDWVLQEEQ